MSVVTPTLLGMHAIVDMEITEDRAGRPRVAWTCECGGKGSGTNQRGAVAGWRRHARIALRKEYS